MEISTEEKNYFRILLKDVSKFAKDKPIALAGKYQYDTRYEYATFTNIRILLSQPYSKTRIICDHLNLHKNEISKFYSLTELDNKKKFYFVGYPMEYVTNGDVRYGFKLAEEVSFAPFGVLSDRDKYQEMIDRECSNLLEWVQNNITDNNMGLLRKNRSEE